MKRGSFRMRVLSVFAAAVVFLQMPAAVFGSWGLEVGRAGPGDVGRLVSDWNAYRMASARLTKDTQAITAIERQKQMLGIAEPDWGPQQWFEAAQEEWLTKIMAPLQSIALNPAASCAEAQFAVSTMIGMKRQQQLLGLDSSALINNVYQATEQMASLRCRDEALDECLSTGRFIQIINLMTSGDRQSQLLGRTEDLESWADDALKQCAIYELHFVSTTSAGHGPVTIETVRDGKVKIRYQTPEGGLKAALSKPLGDILNGKTAGGNNPFFVSVKCTSPLPGVASVTCSPGADSEPIEVRINELDLKHREFYVESQTLTQPEALGRGVVVSEKVMSKERLVGEDKFAFEFGGGMFSLEALIKAPYNTVSMPFGNWGNSFYMAHRKDQIGGEFAQKLLVRNTKRGVTPSIFDFNYPGDKTYGDATTTDSTDFELIHKPEPKPFQKQPDPIRKPLRPKPQ